MSESRAQLRRRLAIKFLGGSCGECGTMEDLEFDHIDPATKLFEISWGLHRKAEVPFWREVEKCQLLCKEHHRLKSRLDGFNRRPAVMRYVTPTRNGRRRSLTQEQVAVAAARYNDGEIYKTIADDFGVAISTVRNAVVEYNALNER